MVDYQTLSIVLTGIGLIIALTYYGLQIRNQNRTRQAQLFMNLYETYRNTEFKNMYTEILFHHQWKDFEDWWSKYGPIENKEAFSEWNSVAGYFNGIGILVKKKLIDMSMVDELLASTIITLWEKMGPNIREGRLSRTESIEPLPILHSNFEYLYNELIKYRKQHPELRT
jgi:hypothetical protein